MPHYDQGGGLQAAESVAQLLLCDIWHGICDRQNDSGSKFVFQHCILPLLATNRPVLHADQSH